MLTNRKKVLFTAIICVIAIELALHILAFMSPQVDFLLSRPLESSGISPTVPDERLGHRPNPAYPNHDKNGFRNPHVPKTAHIVALGDSQTYGQGVKAEYVWPRVLESLTRRSVYSMAYGGYGPVHSLLLWDEAVVLEPAVVIEAFYAGNDLYDSFNLIYNGGQLPSLKTYDKNRMDIVIRAEESEPIATRVSRMIRMQTHASGKDKSIRSWLSKHSRIYGLLRRTRYELARHRPRSNNPCNAHDEWLKAKSFAATHSEYCQVFSNKESGTIFTSEYRLSALNLDDPRISEGQRISLEVISQMHQRAIRDGRRFIALLIPTKELVYGKQAIGIPSANYHALVRNELQFWEETKIFLREHSIEHLDALGSLRAQLEAGPQPYKVSHDGHPNTHGHRVIARAIHSYLNAAQRQLEAE